MREDLEHLRLLAIFHFIVGGLSALCACIPVIHLAIGIAIVSGAFDMHQGGQPPPRGLGWIFILFPAAIMVMGWAFGIGLIIAGRLLLRHKGYTFCLVMAAIACLFMPLGTVLGVFTIIVLLRPSVREIFGRAPRDALLDDTA